MIRLQSDIQSYPDNLSIFYNVGSSFSASAIMLIAFRSCSSEITNGGAKRMMLPCVGLA